MARPSLIVVALAMVLTGCTGSSDTIVLRTTSWQTPDENALDAAAIRTFEQAHPGVRVVNEPVPNQAEYREKVITNIVAGAPPDVLLLDGIDVPAFVDAQVLLDLAPFASRVGLDLNAFYPNVLAMFSRHENVYAFPKGFSPMVMYYNRAMFDRAGVPYPADGWTQADFLATAHKLTRDTDGDGQPDEWGAVIIRPFYAWQAWIWSGGGDILSTDGRRATGALNSPVTDSTIDFLTGLTTREHVAPRPTAFRAVSGAETRLFYGGKLATLPSGHWLIPNIRRELATGNLRLGVTSTPRAPGVLPSTPLFASAWAVPRNSAHRKLAVELAAALSGSDAQRTRLEAGLELSSMPAIQEAFAARDTLGLEPAFLRQVPFGRAPWGATISRYREVEALLPEIIDRVVIKGERVPDVTSDVARRIDAVLAR